MSERTNAILGHLKSPHTPLILKTHCADAARPRLAGCLSCAVHLLVFYYHMVFEALSLLLFPRILVAIRQTCVFRLGLHQYYLVLYQFPIFSLSFLSFWRFAHLTCRKGRANCSIDSLLYFVCIDYIPYCLLLIASCYASDILMFFFRKSLHFLIMIISFVLIRPESITSNHFSLYFEKVSACHMRTVFILLVWNALFTSFDSK